MRAIRSLIDLAGSNDLLLLGSLGWDVMTEERDNTQARRQTNRDSV